MYEFLLGLSVVLFLAVLVWYLKQPAASVFHPLTYYLAFHGLVFVIRPVFAWFYDFRQMYDAIGFHPTGWEKSTVLICTNLALISFTACCIAVGNAPLSFRTPSGEGDRRMALLRAYWPMALVFAALGTWATLFIYSLAGNWDQYRTVDAGTGGAALEGVNGYFISLPALLAPLVAIIAYLARFRWWSFLPFIFFVFVKLGTGGRGTVVAAAVMLGLLYLFEQRRRWPSAVIVAALIPAMLLFDAVGTDRGAAIRGMLGYEVAEVRVRERGAEKPLETMDLANMEFFEYIVWAVPKRTGTYEYFVHNLQIFTEPIPRALWPDKPVGPPIRMFDMYRYATPLGATGSVPGMGWAALGFAGVLIWSGMFGLLYGYGYRVFSRSRGGSVAVIAYTVFAATSVTAFRDGAIMTILKQLMFYFVPVLGLYLVALYVRSTQRGTDEGTRQPLAGTGTLSARDRRRQLLASGHETAEVAAAPMASVAHDVDTPKARRRARLQQAV